MTTVTSLTADRMLAIEAASVIDGDVINGNLILTKHDGTQINAGPVTGAPGPPGPVGQDQPILTAAPVLDVGLSGQIRAGRQLTAADFTAMGLSVPISLWNLSDLSDSSGNGRNLLNKGAVPFDIGINGAANTAAKFIGSSGQALYIPDSGVNDPLKIKSGSWGCWFKTNKVGLQQVVLSKMGGVGNYGWEYYIQGSSLGGLFFSWEGTNYINLSGIINVCDDKWHFAVCTHDGSLVRLYTDGVLEASTLINSILIYPTTGPLNIGGQLTDASTANSNPFFGRIDEAFVTADVLSEDQIRNLYCVKIPHTLAVTPSRVSLNVHRRRKGATLAVADFPTQPLRLHNFSGGSLGDEGSNGLALTNFSAVSVAGVDGSSGNAFSFAGGSGYMFSNDTGLPAGLNTRSYGCWFKSTIFAQNPCLMGWGAGATSSAGATLAFGSGGAIIATSGNDQIIGPYVVDAMWHHVVAVENNAAADGIKRKLYLDGKMVGNSLVMSAITLGGTNRFRIGVYPDGTLAFTGQIDGVFVCDYALTQEQIAILYAKSLTSLASSPKNVGDHVEAMSANSLLATFDSLEMQHTVDLMVAP